MARCQRNRFKSRLATPLIPGAPSSARRIVSASFRGRMARPANGSGSSIPKPAKITKRLRGKTAKLLSRKQLKTLKTAKAANKIRLAFLDQHRHPKTLAVLAVLAVLLLKRRRLSYE